MRKYFWRVICTFLVIFSFSIISWRPVATANRSFTNNAEKSVSATELFGQYVTDVYHTAQLEETGLDLAVFQKAVTGYFNLKFAGKLPQQSNVITVIDFGKSSREKRMWIIDVLNKKLLLNTWVSHGQGSGNDMATAFSDKANSHQSSLGFYVTDNIYYGKHGRSLKLDGMDAGFNASARARAIVVHAADYVSASAINQLGRLGRSHGCPAVSNDVAPMVINTIKNKTLLFINGNDDNYTSKYLNEDIAAQYLSPDSATQTIAKL